jgi:hypothetical protein
MLRKAGTEGHSSPVKLSDFTNASRFELCSGDRRHIERAFAGESEVAGNHGSLAA